MASQVEVVNRALSKLGAARVTSLSDNNKEAREASAAWDIVRDAELRAHNWNFSLERTTLPALAAAPPWGYAYQYQLPSDCLKVVQVDEYYHGVSISDYRGSNEAAWQVEGRVIKTDITAPLKLRYVKRITDVGSWDSMFCEVMACRLAMEMCEAITQSNTKRELAQAEYSAIIRQAMRGDCIENPPEPLPDDGWLMSRL